LSKVLEAAVFQPPLTGSLGIHNVFMFSGKKGYSISKAPLGLGFEAAVISHILDQGPDGYKAIFFWIHHNRSQRSITSDGRIRTNKQVGNIFKVVIEFVL
jgi:hypothetical protein